MSFDGHRSGHNVVRQRFAAWGHARSRERRAEGSDQLGPVSQGARSGRRIAPADVPAVVVIWVLVPNRLHRVKLGATIGVNEVPLLRPEHARQLAAASLHGRGRDHRCREGRATGPAVASHVRLDAMYCANDECRQLVIRVHEDSLIAGAVTNPEEWKWTWLARPRLARRGIDVLVPEPFSADYREAAAILDQSPRMSAVLARSVLADLLEKYADLDDFSLNARIEKFRSDTKHPSGLREGMQHNGSAGRRVRDLDRERCLRHSDHRRQRDLPHRYTWCRLRRALFTRRPAHRLRQRPRREQDIYVMDANGSNEQALTTISPRTLSPNGRPTASGSRF